MVHSPTQSWYLECCKTCVWMSNVQYVYYNEWVMEYTYYTYYNNNTLFWIAKRIKMSSKIVDSH